MRVWGGVVCMVGGIAWCGVKGVERSCVVWGCARVVWCGVVWYRVVDGVTKVCGVYEMWEVWSEII